MNPTGPSTGQTQADQSTRGTGLSFRVLGVPVRLHFTFVLLIIFIVVLGARDGQSGLLNVVFILSIFLSVLLHELGHVSISRRYNIRTLEIVMYPIGGVARLERTPKPAEELWIALAGPAVNVLIAAALFAYLMHMHFEIDPAAVTRPSDTNMLARIALVNLILAAFNMIPAFPMDGGRVLRALLARFRPEDEATRIAAAAGRFFAVGIGLYGLLNQQFMLVFIAFFVYVGASQETAALLGRVLTEGVHVRSAMVTDFRTLDHGNTLRDAANLLLATSQQDFPVVLGGKVIGLLGRTALLRGMAVDGPEAYIAGIMEREFPRVPPELQLTEALPMMADKPCALVMDAQEELLGLLTRENVSEFLMLRRFGMEADRRPKSG